MSESNPPASQASNTSPTLPACSATTDGVRKMPTPTTVPTVRPTTSRKRSDARSAGSCAGPDLASVERGSDTLIAELGISSSERAHPDIGPWSRQPDATPRARLFNSTARSAKLTLEVAMNQTTAVPDVALQVAERLRTLAGVAAVVLGGSAALGDADARSDVDLGLYYDPARPFAIAALGEIARELDDRHAADLVTGFGGVGPWVNGGSRRA